VIADFSRLEDYPNIVSAVADKHVTVFINNAAVTDSPFSLFAEMPRSELERSLNVGVMFTTMLIYETLPILTKNAPSVMVNIGSLSAEIPVPYISVYAATKGFLCVRCHILS
jgi:17beta-estradiol 17-dehydrogenase / very-long-chain 3-oxoacyl-CoA reductase